MDTLGCTFISTLMVRSRIVNHCLLRFGSGPRLCSLHHVEGLATCRRHEKHLPIAHALFCPRLAVDCLHGSCLVSVYIRDTAIGGRMASRLREHFNVPQAAVRAPVPRVNDLFPQEDGPVQRAGGTIGTTPFCRRKRADGLVVSRRVLDSQARSVDFMFFFSTWWQASVPGLPVRAGTFGRSRHSDAWRNAHLAEAGPAAVGILVCCEVY